MTDNSQQALEQAQAQCACTADGPQLQGASLRALWIDRLWLIILCGALYAVLFREELIGLFTTWTSDASESHGFLIPGFSLYFLYQFRKRLCFAGKPSWMGLLLILASVLGYVYFFYIQMYYPRQIMMITMLAGLVLMLGGWRMLKITWLPIFFLIFAMPLPARLYYQISMPMREMSSLVAAMILNGLPNVTAEAFGVIIHGVRGAESFSLNVAEACSGMRLLRAFVALGVAMAYLEYRPPLHRLILLGSTIPIAIFCNMLRVLITGLIHIYAGAEYATGMLHTLLGLVTLGVAFGLYGLLAMIMNRLVIEEDEEEDVIVVNQNEGSSSSENQ